MVSYVVLINKKPKLNLLKISKCPLLDIILNIFLNYPKTKKSIFLIKSIWIKTRFTIWPKSFCLSHFRVIDPMIWYLHLLWTLNVRWYKNISVEYFITWTSTLSNLSFYRIYANHYSPSYETHVFHSLENGSNIFVFPLCNIYFGIWSEVTHTHSQK